MEPLETIVSDDEEIKKRIERIPLPLARGYHTEAAGKANVLEAASIAAGEGFNARPEAVSVVIADILEPWNNALGGKARARLLTGLVTDIIQSGADEDLLSRTARRRRALNWLIGDSLPIWLDSAGFGWCRGDFTGQTWICADMEGAPRDENDLGTGAERIAAVLHDRIKGLQAGIFWETTRAEETARTAVDRAAEKSGITAVAAGVDHWCADYVVEAHRVCAEKLLNAALYEPPRTANKRPEEHRSRVRAMQTGRGSARRRAARGLLAETVGKTQDAVVELVQGLTDVGRV